MAIINVIKKQVGMIEDVGKVEHSKHISIFKLTINLKKQDLDIKTINKCVHNIYEKFSSNQFIPLKKINTQSIIIDKIDSEDGNSDLQISFNDRENAHAYITGTKKKKIETIKFFIELQKLTNNYFNIVIDDDTFPGNTGFGIASQGLYPLITLADTMKNKMNNLISFEQYCNRDPIIPSLINMYHENELKKDILKKKRIQNLLKKIKKNP